MFLENELNKKEVDHIVKWKYNRVLGKIQYRFFRILLSYKQILYNKV
jgi:hypothetical protein